jgi:hypothetical protein
MALALHDGLDGGGGSDQGEVEAVDVVLEDEDVVLPQIELLHHGLPTPHEEQLALVPLHVDAVLAEVAVVEWPDGTCLRRHLQHPGHLPGYGRRHDKDGKVARPELDVEAPCHLDDLVISQARFTARRRLGLPLPEIGDRPRNFRACVNVGVHGELVLHVQRPVHVAGDGGVPVLYMMSRMIPQ